MYTYDDLNAQNVYLVLFLQFKSGKGNRTFLSRIQSVLRELTKNFIRKRFGLQITRDQTATVSPNIETYDYLYYLFCRLKRRRRWHFFTESVAKLSVNLLLLRPIVPLL